MFPNQAGRDSWGSVQGYYGNYGSSSSWYNWAGQSGSRPNNWGYQSSAGSGTESEQESQGGQQRINDSKSQKLGINSNIYSLYQNRSQSMNVTPDVTLSSVSNMPPLTRAGKTIEGGFARKEERHYGQSSEPQNSESLFTSCMQEQTDLDSLKRSSGGPGASHPPSESQGGGGGGRSGEDRHHHPARGEEEDRADTDLKYDQPELTIDEGSCMEPDSSTDVSLEQVSNREKEERLTGSSRADAQHSARFNRESHNSISRRGVNEENEGGLQGDQERMARHSKQFAQLFKVKSESQLYEGESSYKRRKFDSPLVEISEWLAESKRNAAAAMEKRTGSGLPLSVEIDELEAAAQPSAHRNPLSLLHGSYLSSSLSPRKRGRKPKHYSEILHELGQRGISITKTQRNNPSPPSAAGLHQPHPHLINQTESNTKSGNQQLQCPHCNKILTTSVGLMYHIRLHTGEKPYSCDLCGKSFATSSHYHYHIRTHSGEKPYRCDFCGKMYTASGSLRLHLKSHLSRLSANVFGLGMNMDGMNMFRGLEAMMGERTAGGGEATAETNSSGSAPAPADVKFNIKQEIQEADVGRRGGDRGVMLPAAGGGPILPENIGARMPGGHGDPAAAAAHPLPHNLSMLGT